MNKLALDAILYAKTNKLDKLVHCLTDGVNIDASDDDGVTLLMHASLRGHTQIVKELLHRGADPNARTKSGSTAYVYARAGEQDAIMRMLHDKTSFAKGYDIHAILSNPVSTQALNELWDALRREGHRELNEMELTIVAVCELMLVGASGGLGSLIEMVGYWVIPATRFLFREIGEERLLKLVSEAEVTIIEWAERNGESLLKTTGILQLDQTAIESLDQIDSQGVLDGLSIDEIDLLNAKILTFVRINISYFSDG